MSFQTVVLERLSQITSQLNAIVANAKRIFELPTQETLEPTSLLHVSNNQVSQQLEIQKLLDYFETLGYVKGDDIFQFNTVLQSSYRWISDYTYEVVWVKYLLYGEVKTVFFNTEITLDAADATFDRKDRIVLNIDTETITFVTGDAVAEPSPKPLEDNQLSITIIDVDANTTQPNGVTNEDVYLDNAEWTSSISGSVNADSTNNPETGTKSIYFNIAGSGDYVQLDKGSDFSLTNATQVILRLYQTVAGNNKFLMEASNSTETLGTVQIQHNSYGYNKNTLNAWQTIIVPIAQLNLVGAAAIKTLKLSANSNSISVYIDNVVIQYGTEPSTNTGDFLPTGGYAGTAQDLKDEILPIITISGRPFRLRKTVNVNDPAKKSTQEINDVIEGSPADGEYIIAQYLGGDVTDFNNPIVYNIIIGI